MAGNASRESTLDFAAIAREILADARAIDEAEDEEFGEARGDELPEQLRTREGRAEFFGRVRGERAAGQEQGASKLGDERPADEPAADPQAGYEFDSERIVARVQGRDGWSREARRQLEQRRWRDPDPVLRSRDGRLLLAAQRLEAERDAVIAGNQAYEQYRAGGRDKTGRRFGRATEPVGRARSARGSGERERS
jgi:hypothetical protein